jgi:hypothetical protein
VSNVIAAIGLLSACALLKGRAHGLSPADFDSKQLSIGTRHEMEHTPDPAVAQRIAMDHLAEDADYYGKLARAGLSSVSDDRRRSFDREHWAHYEEKIEEAAESLRRASTTRSGSRKILQDALEKLQGGDGTITMFINSESLRHEWKTASDTMKMLIQLELGRLRNLEKKD